MIAVIGQFYKEQLFDGGNYEVGKMLYCGIGVYNAADKAGRRFEKFLHNFAADLTRHSCRVITIISDHISSKYPCCGPLLVKGPNLKTRVRYIC